MEDNSLEEKRTYWRLVVDQFLKSKTASIGLITLTIIILLAVFAPWIAPYDPASIDPMNIEAAPSLKHPMGTDRMGRDVFSRILFGARISLTVAFVAALTSSLVGTIFGVLAGYIGGIIDVIIMRIVDIFLSFPMLPIALVLAAILGPNPFNIVIVSTAVTWSALARIVRGQFLSLREEDYTHAARSLGASDLRIAFRHLLPNAMAPVIVWATLNAAQVILLEAGLSFLGLGVQIPTPTWGNLLMDAQSLRILENLPWLWVPPGVMIFVTVLSINFVGDGLRDALDPFLKANV